MALIPPKETVVRIEMIPMMGESFLGQLKWTCRLGLKMNQYRPNLQTRIEILELK